MTFISGEIGGTICMIITMGFVVAAVTIEGRPVVCSRWSVSVSLVGLLALTIGVVILPMNLGLNRLGAMRIRMKNGRMPAFSYHQAKHPTLRITSPLQALRERRKT